MADVNWTRETVEAELDRLEASLEGFGLRTPFRRAKQLAALEADWASRETQTRWQSRLTYWREVLLGEGDQDALAADLGKRRGIETLLENPAARKLLFETTAWEVYAPDGSYRFERAQDLLEGRPRILGLEPVQMERDADYDWWLQHPRDRLFQVAHQNGWHFMYLALAQLHQPDEKWVREWAREVICHVTDCPRLPNGYNDFSRGPNPGRPANVAWSHYGYVGVRLKYLVLTYSVMKDSPALPSRFQAILLRMVRAHARHLDALGRKAFASNYLTATGQALYLAAALFPELKESGPWLDHLWPNFVAGMKRELLEDGCHFHRSLSYHLTFVQRPLGAVLVAKALGRADELPADFVALLQKAVQAFVQVSTPIRSTPGVNDDWTVNISYHDVLGLAAEALDRADWRYLATDGERGTAPDERSALLPKAQLIAQRSDWSSKGRYLFFNVSPDGGHHHADTLSIQIWADGRRLLIDPGTGHYYTGERGLYTRSWWHNCPTFGAQQLPNSCSPRILHWETSDELDYAVGQIDVPVPGATGKAGIRRHVFFVDRAYWVFWDEFTGLPQKGPVWENFHFATPALKISSDGRQAHTLLPEGPNLLLSVGSSGWQVKSEKAQKWLVYGGQGLPTQVLHYEADPETASRGFAALLVPLKQGESTASISLDHVESLADGRVRLRITISGRSRAVVTRKF